MKSVIPKDIEDFLINRTFSETSEPTKDQVTTRIASYTGQMAAALDEAGIDIEKGDFPTLADEVVKVTSLWVGVSLITDPVERAKGMKDLESNFIDRLEKIKEKPELYTSKAEQPTASPSPEAFIGEPASWQICAGGKNW